MKNTVNAKSDLEFLLRLLLKVFPGVFIENTDFTTNYPEPNKINSIFSYLIEGNYWFIIYLMVNLLLQMY